MKKKLVVLLAVVMMFAFAATAYAVDFSDISEQPVTVQDAIAKTTALGIIEGYTDGTFGPEQNITRAEFAKIAVTAAGAKDTAAMLEKNASSFKDVKAGVWYTGWINASESLGIFQGDGNGNFRPNDSISNQEVVTVLMRLLGYNDNLTGTWPTNYITQANKVGILDDVAIVASAAAKRADVVVMLDDTLDTELVTYDKDTNEFVMKQNKVADSKAKTLLDDSFKGQVVEYTKFDKVEQVRDAAAKTLTWNVGTEKTAGDAPYDALIIDKDTKVSHNAASLFDLEGHQGKVYFVKDGSKYYARFIEVKSYTKTVTTKPTQDGEGEKVKVDKTSYNAAKTFALSDPGDKNSNYVMYFNEDDQVYLVKSDREFKEQSYYVKSVANSSVKLVHGVKTTTKSMSDDATLIWDGEEFVAPSTLKAGDAIMEISDDLYVKVDEATGEVTKSDKDKITIGGKAVRYSDIATDPVFIDDTFEDAGVVVDDVYGNNVKYILDKDNSVAAIMVDETSTGTTLYGIVVDGGSGSNSWSNSFTSITLFTAEGKTVTYDLTDDPTYLKDGDDNVSPTEDWMGKPVEYQLNKDGEIKMIKPIGPIKDVDVVNGKVFDVTAADASIDVENKTYLKGTDKATGKETTVTLAANVVIFEVDVDSKGNVDPSLVTRASLLAGGDFKPAESSYEMKVRNVSDAKLAKYAVYKTNSNGAVKVLAYTNAGGTEYNYGVLTAYNFKNADNDYNVTLADGNTYELTADNIDKTLCKAPKNTKVTNDDLIIYKLSGDKIDIQASYAEKDALAKAAKTQVVKGFTDGLIAFDQPMDIDFAAADKYEEVYNIMTDTDTAVYVLNDRTGKYEAGTLENISKGAYVYVPVVDKDGYADLVIVDEFADYTVQNAINYAPEITENDNVSVKVNASDKTKITVTITVDDPSTITLSDYADYDALKFALSGKGVTLEIKDHQEKTLDKGDLAYKNGVITYTYEVDRGFDDIVYTITIKVVAAPTKA